MFKLVVTDLDGTFLNGNRLVSAENKKAIKQLQAAGIKICFASGRPFKGMDRFAKEVGLGKGESYFITNTGARAYNYNSRQLIYNKILNMSDYLQLAKYIEDDDVQIVAYGEDKLYSFSKNINDTLKYDQSILKMEIEVIDSKSFSNLNFGRMNIMGSKTAIDNAVSKIPVDFLSQYYTVRNEDFSFEFENKMAGKGNALKALAKYLNLDLDTEVLTFGDNFNDLEMLMATGNSVSMGQSCDAIKSKTKYVADTNCNDGFAKMVYKLVFNKGDN